MNINYKQLSRNLKGVRVKAGLTQQQASNLLNIHRSALSRYEDNPQTIKLIFILKLMQIYNCTIDEIFYGIGGNHSCYN